MTELLLAVDTSGRNGGLALARTAADERDVDVLQVIPLDGGAFSAQLVPQIAALLSKHGYVKRDLSAFAVVTGPGSFTGLRVGLAAIKALAEAMEKPIAAVSLLEAVAIRSGARRMSGDRILAALDAGRSDVYVGDYEFGGSSDANIRMHSERLLSREEFLEEVVAAAAAGKSVATTDSNLADAIQAAVLIEYPNAGVIAQIGWEHLLSGQTVSPENLEANYIRHSDAQIFSKPVA